MLYHLSRSAELQAQAFVINQSCASLTKHHAGNEVEANRGM
jgi:hypothetical protein